MIQRWMGAIFTTLFFAMFILAMWIVYSRAGPSYPPIGYLASELGVARGQQLPKGVYWNGRPYYFFIVGASQRPNGHYLVELEAK